MAGDTAISISVAYSPAPRVVHEVALVVELGCTVAQAVVQSGLLSATPRADLELLELGIWGRKVGARQILRANDRVEIYRPLRVDPKVARRERFASQGAKTAGLFAKRRLGGKAGY